MVTLLRLSARAESRLTHFFQHGRVTANGMGENGATNHRIRGLEGPDQQPLSCLYCVPDVILTWRVRALKAIMTRMTYRVAFEPCTRGRATNANCGPHGVLHKTTTWLGLLNPKITIHTCVINHSAPYTCNSAHSHYSYMLRVTSISAMPNDLVSTTTIHTSYSLQVQQGITSTTLPSPSRPVHRLHHERVSRAAI